jgi:nitroreductase
VALDSSLVTERPVTPEALIGARYRDGSMAMGPWNEVLATILAHRSVRAYLRDPLPAGTLECLVAAAQSASTSSNLQTWSVVAVEDPARKARLAELASGQKHIVQCPLYLVWCVDLARLRRAAEERQIVLEGLDYLEPFIVGVVDAALAAQNAAIALESLGLGFVLIGAMRNHPEEVAAELGLPPHVMALFGMCVGYPDPAVPTGVKPRLPQQAVLHREQYSAAPQSAAFGEYNRRIRGFQREQRMPEIDWTQQATTRVRTAASLHGRDRIRQALGILGFALR